MPQIEGFNDQSCGFTGSLCLSHILHTSTWRDKTFVKWEKTWIQYVSFHLGLKDNFLNCFMVTLSPFLLTCLVGCGSSSARRQREVHRYHCGCAHWWGVVWRPSGCMVSCAHWWLLGKWGMASAPGWAVWWMPWGVPSMELAPSTRRPEDGWSLRLGCNLLWLKQVIYIL